MKIVGHSAGQAQALSTHLGYVRQLHLKPIVDGLVWPIDLPRLRI